MQGFNLGADHSLFISRTGKLTAAGKRQVSCLFFFLEDPTGANVAKLRSWCASDQSFGMHAARFLPCQTNEW